ncbi:MAG TPA: sigma 54-interacting transcriptional regulator, partial [Candidatus Angelobacter sp.]|nr:sigma 54-interacting transcriptional regulator [Candidatus Angelobacter sp.]
TGKKMLAEAIHSYSPNHNEPFFCLNCALTSSADLEKELFGINDGTEVKEGLIEADNKGSLLLKNIEKSDLSFQEKLAELILHKQFVRSDGTRANDCKVRIITSSSMDLEGLVEVGRFHTQLFLIMAANTIEIPPLRARREDFDSLLLHFKKRFNYSHFLFSEETLNFLRNYSWPGNVSELFNILSYCACLKESPVTIPSLPYYLQEFLAKEDHFIDGQKIIEAIEKHGFLDESVAMLDLLLNGKKSRTSYGRKTLESLLKNTHGILLSEQQLRKRLEVLHELDLIQIRQGRSGTTISRKGEWFLNLHTHYQKNG